MKFPLVFGPSKSGWPETKGICGVCQRKLVDEVVYLSAGFCAEFDDLQLLRDRDVFMHCGIHTKRSDCIGNVDVAIVDLPDQEQFDLLFCSLECLQNFFLSIVARIEAERKNEGSEVDNSG